MKGNLKISGYKTNCLPNKNPAGFAGFLFIVLKIWIRFA